MNHAALKVSPDKGRKLMRYGKVRKEIPAYRSWMNMRLRCRDERIHGYHNYGGRGITVCARWSSFENFYEDMGDRPENCSLDRIDVNGNYEPGNCKWSTIREQHMNRRTARIIEYRGVKKHLYEWAEIMKIPVSALECRIRFGWDVERAFGKYPASHARFKTTEEQRNEIKKIFMEGESAKSIASRLGLSKSGIYNIINETVGPKQDRAIG